MQNDTDWTDKAEDAYEGWQLQRVVYMNGVIDCLLAQGMRETALKVIRKDVNTFRTEGWVSDMGDLVDEYSEVEGFQELKEELDNMRGLAKFPRVPWLDLPDLEQYLKD